MENNPKTPITGLLKSLLGFGKPNNEAFTTEPSIASAHSEPNPASAEPRPPQRNALPPTEAYQNRKKGRKLHSVSWKDLQALLTAIQSRGEAVPGDLAAELGMSRSTLVYNLNRLVKKGRIERLGGGRSIRYRVAQGSPK